MDSLHTVKALSDSCLVPRKLRNRWDNVWILLKGIQFRFSHTFRKGNRSADSLAVYGL